MRTVLRHGYPAVFNDEEEQDEIGPAAAVLDVAASLDTTSAKSLFSAAGAVHNATAELERTGPSSILSGAAASPDETSAAAVLHLSEGLLKVADAVYNSSVALHKTLQAAAAFNATALHDETSVGFLFKVALNLTTLQQYCIKPVLLELCLVPQFLSWMLQSNRM